MYISLKFDFYNVSAFIHDSDVKILPMRSSVRQTLVFFKQVLISRKRCKTHT